MSNRINEFLKETDQKQLLNFLKEFFKEVNLVKLELLIKKELKDKDSMLNLIEQSKMGKDDFFFYLVTIFSKKLFNKLMLKRINLNLR